ncbi:MAG: hypothetical protein CMG06_01100 [Candidatus Marinimicrobia bacterium]|nr:hypothetical protein [Candidatus Neomarinimicrobiota bacterium]|tara:strand:+ start:1090 stop:1554 length:465 start_codon:yes stop_codon:yes gene_type:complete
MKNTKLDDQKIARRRMNSVSSKILHELYELYPSSISLSNLAKELDLREKTVKASINKSLREGIPIEQTMSSSDDIAYRADPSEPISYILKEKESAEVMLKLIEDTPLNGNEDANKKKKINHRIYGEYVSALNDLLDKWTSLRLLDHTQNGNGYE